MILSALLVKETLLWYRFWSLKVEHSLQMEKVNSGYSLKNIPTPDGRLYKLQLIEKMELFRKKLQWKAIFFINNNMETTESCASGSAYGLESNKCLLQLKELIPFKDDLVDGEKY